MSARLLQSIYAIAAIVLLVTTADRLCGGFKPGLAEVALYEYTDSFDSPSHCEDDGYDFRQNPFQHGGDAWFDYDDLDDGELEDF